MDSNKHVPVLQKEAIDGLALHEDSIVLDMTLGRGGDSSEILKRIPNGFLYSCDKDITALQYSQDLLQKIGKNYCLHQGNYSDFIPFLKKEKNLKGADAILFDIGVSSPQFDNPERGFSYKEDGPLDMRMDLSQSLTAEKVVNTYSEAQLKHIILEYGEDRSAGRIAHAIVEARKKKPITRTVELADIIVNALPSFIRNKKGHPAKQTFQAIRYEVNNEEGELIKGVKEALSFLNLHGRVAVITFNSLEDRIVKRIFKEVAVPKEVDKYAPIDPKEEKLSYSLVTRKPIEPSEEELKVNPRSHSAKLRIIERTHVL